MNYYDDIKEILINNEITRKVKDYSKNKSDLDSYYNVGKMLIIAGKKYGDKIIIEYSKKLTTELGKGYTPTRLRYFRRFYYVFSKCPTLSDKLTFSHYCEIMWFDSIKMNYYISVSIKNNLSVRELRNRVKTNEYERLSDEIKNKMSSDNEYGINDFIKHPIVISNNGYEVFTEKLLQKLILENMSYFLKELGDGFCYIENEYKIKIGDRYNYIDLLLFNVVYNCYVVVELKITELKKEHIGQIEVYMNYIDTNLKLINHDRTIGIIICKKDNHFIMEYCSDKRIFSTNYVVI